MTEDITGEELSVEYLPTYCEVVISNAAGGLRDFTERLRDDFVRELQAILATLVLGNTDTRKPITVDVLGVSPSDDRLQGGHNIVILLGVGPTHHLASGLDLNRFYSAMLVPALRRLFGQTFQIANVRLRIEMKHCSSLEVRMGVVP